MDKRKVFECLLNQFETDEMRNYCADMIEKIPDYIFTIPSSTSFKYHNKTQCQPHGQIYHILMFAEIMFLGWNMYRAKLTQEKEIACAAHRFFTTQSNAAHLDRSTRCTNILCWQVNG